MRWQWYAAVLLGLAFSASGGVLAYGQDPVDPQGSPAEKIRKALDQKMSIEFRGNSLEEALQHLQQKTHVPFVVDQFALQQMGIFDGPAMALWQGAIGPGGAPPQPGQPAQRPVTLKGDRPRTALQGLLNANGLTYVILGDQVVVTTEELGIQRQMRQRVTVDADSQPLAKLLQKLAGGTALTLVIDPRSAKDALTPVSLKLEDVSVETAVRMASELAGLKAVRIGEVVFVTDDARAEKIRKENDQLLQQRINGGAPVPPLAFGNRFGAIIGAGVGQAFPGRDAPAIEVAPAQPPMPDRPPPPKKN